MAASASAPSRFGGGGDGGGEGATSGAKEAAALAAMVLRPTVRSLSLLVFLSRIYFAWSEEDASATVRPSSLDARLNRAPRVLSLPFMWRHVSERAHVYVLRARASGRAL